MNYAKIYANLTKPNNRRKGLEYFEAHHIVPRHQGGTDDKSNIVLLTYREHVLAHRLLFAMYGNAGDIRAVSFMAADAKARKKSASLAGQIGITRMTTEQRKRGGRQSGLNNVTTGHMKRLNDSKRRPCIHVETDTEYESLTALCKALNMGHSNLASYGRSKGVTVIFKI